MDPLCILELTVDGFPQTKEDNILEIFFFFLITADYSLGS